MSSPIGVSTPTINDQEFPDNSLLNDNDSLIWYKDDITPRAKEINNDFDSLILNNNNNNNNNYHLDDFYFTKDDNVSPISSNCSNNSSVAFENMLPDYLTNGNENVENSLKKEYKSLLKMNEMFGKINNNMNQARVNLQQFYTTVEQTDQLLDLWIGLLSQSVHTQKILCDPSWHGDSIEKMRILEEQAKQPPK
ncbi:unnamed protein product [Rhizophagus irregularis]|uniref:DASH complex subunit DUO1 n=1 Tax=Rhizophagus irregularis TaxID=588596 RepID=A0A2I1GLI3_9GLOM|nr:hypothetical protein RhiirA4_444877 [Rhizophagus irregularis]CAB4422807.1 unnamed protein product [Rhizophagus irregularis]